MEPFLDEVEDEARGCHEVLRFLRRLLLLVLTQFVESRDCGDLGLTDSQRLQ